MKGNILLYYKPKRDILETVELEIFNYTKTTACKQIRTCPNSAFLCVIVS